MRSASINCNDWSSSMFDSIDLHGAVFNSSTKHSLHDPEPCERPTKKACSGSRRIPCKARGLSGSHNKDTAFFTIPDDAPHGLIVNCSHPECFGTDRSFRYCIVCECPVAKRNFLKRHGHDLIYTTAQLKEEVDDKYKWVIAPPVIMSECSPVAETTARPSKIRKHNRIISFDGSINQTIAEQRSCDDLTQEEREWLTLLRNRPPLNDTSSLSKWFEVVMDPSARVKSSARSQSGDTVMDHNVVSQSPRRDVVPSEDFLEAQFTADLSEPYITCDFEASISEIGNFNVEEVDFSKIFDNGFIIPKF